jgi:hypothetical protein
LASFSQPNRIYRKNVASPFLNPVYRSQLQNLGSSDLVMEFLTALERQDFIGACNYSATHGRGAVGEELTTDFSDGHG